MDERTLTHSAVIARLDRATQYAAAYRFDRRLPAYWIPAFAGMTSDARGTSENRTLRH